MNLNIDNRLTDDKDIIASNDNDAKSEEANLNLEKFSEVYNLDKQNLRQLVKHMQILDQKLIYRDFAKELEMSPGTFSRMMRKDGDPMTFKEETATKLFQFWQEVEAKQVNKVIIDKTRLRSLIHNLHNFDSSFTHKKIAEYLNIPLNTFNSCFYNGNRQLVLTSDQFKKLEDLAMKISSAQKLSINPENNQSEDREDGKVTIDQSNFVQVIDHIQAICPSITNSDIEEYLGISKDDLGFLLSGEALIYNLTELQIKRLFGLAELAENRAMHREPEAEKQLTARTEDEQIIIDQANLKQLVDFMRSLDRFLELDDIEETIWLERGTLKRLFCSEESITMSQQTIEYLMALVEQLMVESQPSELETPADMVPYGSDRKVMINKANLRQLLHYLKTFSTSLHYRDIAEKINMSLKRLQNLLGGSSKTMTGKQIAALFKLVENFEEIKDRKKQDDEPESASLFEEQLAAMPAEIEGDWRSQVAEKKDRPQLVRIYKPKQAESEMVVLADKTMNTQSISSEKPSISKSYQEIKTDILESAPLLKEAYESRDQLAARLGKMAEKEIVNLGVLMNKLTDIILALNDFYNVIEPKETVELKGTIEKRLPLLRSLFDSLFFLYESNTLSLPNKLAAFGRIDGISDELRQSINKMQTDYTALLPQIRKAAIEKVKTMMIEALQLMSKEESPEVIAEVQRKLAILAKSSQKEQNEKLLESVTQVAQTTVDYEKIKDQGYRPLTKNHIGLIKLKPFLPVISTDVTLSQLGSTIPEPFLAQKLPQDLSGSKRPVLPEKQEQLDFDYERFDYYQDVIEELEAATANHKLWVPQQLPILTDLINEAYNMATYMEYKVKDFKGDNDDKEKRTEYWWLANQMWRKILDLAHCYKISVRDGQKDNNELKLNDYPKYLNIGAMAALRLARAADNERKYTINSSHGRTAAARYRKAAEVMRRLKKEMRGTAQHDFLACSQIAFKYAKLAADIQDQDAWAKVGHRLKSHGLIIESAYNLTSYGDVLEYGEKSASLRDANGYKCLDWEVKVVKAAFVLGEWQKVIGLGERYLQDYPEAIEVMILIQNSRTELIKEAFNLRRFEECIIDCTLYLAKHPDDNVVENIFKKAQVNLSKIERGESLSYREV